LNIVKRSKRVERSNSLTEIQIKRIP